MCLFLEFGDVKEMRKRKAQRDAFKKDSKFYKVIAVMFVIVSQAAAMSGTTQRGKENYGSFFFLTFPKVSVDKMVFDRCIL